MKFKEKKENRKSKQSEAIKTSKKISLNYVNNRPHIKIVGKLTKTKSLSPLENILRSKNQNILVISENNGASIEYSNVIYVKIKVVQKQKNKRNLNAFKNK